MVWSHSCFHYTSGLRLLAAILVTFALVIGTVRRGPAKWVPKESNLACHRQVGYSHPVLLAHDTLVPEESVRCLAAGRADTPQSLEPGAGIQPANTKSRKAPGRVGLAYPGKIGKVV